MVQNLLAGKLDEAMRLLPSTVEEACKGTPIQMLTAAVGEKRIEAFIAFELTMLASMVNVDQRLNLQPHQIPVIAQELMKNFKTENLADFHVCFRRGSMGFYDDKLLRLDGAVIMQWMFKYLEEKYQVVENNLNAKKENPAPFSKEEVNPNRNLLALLKTVVGDYDLPKTNNAKINDYERYKLDNQYRYYDVRGIQILAKSQIHAEEIVKKMIETGDLEEI